MATQYGDWGSIKTNRANYRLYVTYSITEAADSYTVNLTEIGVQIYSKTYRTVALIGTWDVLVNGSVIWSSGSGSGTEVPTNKDGVTRSNFIARLTGLSKKIAKTHSSQTAYVTFRGVNVKPECLSDSGWVSGTERGPAVTASASIPAKTSYTISFNTQGGSGSFGDLTKWHGEPLTIHSGKPTKANYTFVNWKIRNTSTTVDPGKQIAAGSNGNYVLDAQWKIITYPVTFDANGGTGGPVNTTKNSGSALTFSSAKPTKKDASSGKEYDFLGWAETSAPNTIVYPVGNTTIAANVNRAVNLIAVWREHYYSPTITNTKIFRCNKNGKASDEGKYAYVSFDWAVDNWKYPTNTASEVSITVGETTVTIPEAVDRLSGSVSIKIGSDPDVLFDVDTEYPVTISVADKQASTETLYKTTVTGRLNVAEYPLDFGSAVNSIGVFKPASDEAEYEKVMDIGGEVVISGSNENNDRQFHISVKKNENSGDIGWNWANGDGAGIGLRSADREDAPGEFQIYARNSTEGHHTLIGRTNGWLVWNGNFQTLGFDGNHVSKFGCQNADFCHIYTDATYFAINKTIAMVGQGGIGTPSYPCGSMRIARASAIYLNVGSSRDSTYIEGYDTGGTDNIMLYADGYIAMYCGSTSAAPAAKAYVMQGGITSYVNITAPKFVTSSDKRLKENIKELDIDVDDILLKLNPVEYNWIEDYNESKEKHFGFVAQDVQKILEDAGLDADDLGIITKFDLPEHETLKDKYYALSYEEFVPLLVEGYKKQHDEIEDLKKQVEELKELVSALNAGTY